jgi:hypothetical protein
MNFTIGSAHLSAEWRRPAGSGPGARLPASSFQAPAAARFLLCAARAIPGTRYRGPPAALPNFRAGGPIFLIHWRQ